MKKTFTFIAIVSMVMMSTIAFAQTYQNNFQADYPHLNNMGDTMWVSNRTFTKVDNAQQGYFLFAEGISPMLQDTFGLSAVRYDNNWNVTWNKLIVIPGFENDTLKPRDVKYMSSSNGFIACGHVNMQGTNMSFGFIGEFDINANNLWFTIYHDVKNLEAIVEVQNFPVNGSPVKYVACGEGMNGQAVALGVDPAGATVWSVIDPSSTPTISLLNDVIQIQGGANFAFTGWEIASGNKDVLFAVMDINGVVGTSRSYTRAGTEVGRGIYMYGSELYITGMCDANVLLMKVQQNGNALWYNSYDQLANLRGVALYQSGEELLYYKGQFYIAGHMDVSQSWFTDNAFMLEINPATGASTQCNFFALRAVNKFFNIEINHANDGVVGCGYDVGGATHDVRIDPPYIAELYDNYYNNCNDVVVTGADFNESYTHLAYSLVNIHFPEAHLPHLDIPNIVIKRDPCKKVFLHIRKAGATQLSESTDIKVYPSPAEDVLEIEGYEGDYTYEIYSISGALQAKGKLSNNHSIVDVNELPTGVYLISVKSESDIQNFRFVKK